MRTPRRRTIKPRAPTTTRVDERPAMRLITEQGISRWVTEDELIRELADARAEIADQQSRAETNLCLGSYRDSQENNSSISNQ